MLVTVLYISQGLRTKAVKAKGLRLPHGLAARREMQVLCALHKADEPSVEEEVATDRSLFHIKLLCTKLPGTEWLCKEVGDLPSACPSLFPRLLLKDSCYKYLKLSPKELLLKH